MLIATRQKNRLEYIDEEGNEHNIDKLLGLFASEDVLNSIREKVVTILSHTEQISVISK